MATTLKKALKDRLEEDAGNVELGQLMRDLLKISRKTKLNLRDRVWIEEGALRLGLLHDASHRGRL